MRNPKFVFFLVFVIVAVGLAFYDYQSEQRREDAKLESSKLFNASLEAVKSFRISNPQSSFLVIREGSGWRVEGSFQDKANGRTVEDFLDSILEEKSKEGIVVENDEGLKPFGFEAAKGKLELNFDSGESISYSVGARKNFQGDSYLRRNNERAALVASPIWSDHVSKKDSDFRDLRLMRGDLSQVNRVELLSEAGKDKLVLEKEGEAWALKSGLSFPLEQNKVREFIFKMGETSGIEVLSEGKESPEQVKTLNLKKAKMEIRFFKKDESQPFYQSQLYVSSGNIHSYRSSETGLLMKVSPTDSQDLQSVFDHRFYDRGIPFDFKVPEVQQMSVSREGRTEQFRLLDKKWSFVTERADQEVANDVVAQSLSRLSSLEFKDLHPEGKKKTLKKDPDISLELFGTDQALVKSIQIFLGPKSESSVYVRVGGFSQIFEMSPESIDGLNLKLWTKKKEQSSESLKSEAKPKPKLMEEKE